ncbi:hypothetical protein K457DRAFT_120710 [Linnemannia elongata AG-77]|uniref:Uncharacterized protein n=1 Tax=Linnemannia elongata AG-77 TaxID=1314771 RepID=A0A197KEM8_9FUNG|nr:hypothetical protein K457DRAFT_120710 [Linnemannia elongata AG-77]
MYCIRAFLPLLLLPFPSTAPYFVILYYISLYRHHRPCVYCVFTVILLFSTTCYWGADRCWLDLNSFHIFDPIRHMDGSPTSTFGLQLPAILTSIEDYLESFLRILGGGEPLATVIKAGTNYSALAPKAAATAVSVATSASTTATAIAGGGIDSAADAVTAVLLAAAAP